MKTEKIFQKNPLYILLPFEIYDAFMESNSIRSSEYIQSSVYTCKSVHGLYNSTSSRDIIASGGQSADTLAGAGVVQIVF